MIRRPPRSTRTDTLVPYTTLFRSAEIRLGGRRRAERIHHPRQYPVRTIAAAAEPQRVDRGIVRHLQKGGRALIVGAGEMPSRTGALWVADEVHLGKGDRSERGRARRAGHIQLEREGRSEEARLGNK